MTTNPRDVLILHGLNGFPSQFREFTKRLETLPEVNRVYTPLLPATSLKGMANAIYQYMQQHHITRPILIGYSMGATLAAHLYTRAPLRFDRRMIFISPWIKKNRLLIPGSIFMALGRDRDHYTYGEGVMQGLFVGSHGAMDYLKPFFKDRAACDYPHLLVLYGEQDNLVRPQRVRKCLKKLCDRSITGDDFLRAEQIEGGTHTMVLDDPAKQEVIVQEIYHFLVNPAKRPPIDHRRDIHQMEKITS